MNDDLLRKSRRMTVRILFLKRITIGLFFYENSNKWNCFSLKVTKDLALITLITSVIYITVITSIVTVNNGNYY